MMEPEVGAQNKNAYVGYGVFCSQRKRARRGIATQFLIKKEEQDFQNPKLGVPQFFVHKASRNAKGRRNKIFENVL